MQTSAQSARPWQPGQPAIGAALWRGSELSRDETWRTRLNAEAIAEIDHALAHARRAGVNSILAMNDEPGEFPLSGLATTLAGIGEALHEGRGFAVLEGLPVDKYSAQDQAIILRGISAFLGLCVSQNHRGERVGRVIDRSDEIADPRRYEAGGEFRMHIDPIDIVGLLCVRKARRGGESTIVSAMQVHNTLLEEEPALLERLYRGFRLYRPYPDRGERPAMTAGRVPVFAADAAGAFSSYFLPDPVIQGVKRGHNTLDAQEEAALVYAEQVACREDLVLSMDLRPGDIQFLNNRRILHGRADYLDYPEQERRRLMLRIWLMNPAWPALSPAQRFFDDSHRAGGGIVPQ